MAEMVACAWPMEIVAVVVLCCDAAAAAAAAAAGAACESNAAAPSAAPNPSTGVSLREGRTPDPGSRGDSDCDWCVADWPTCRRVRPFDPAGVRVATMPTEWSTCSWPGGGCVEGVVGWKEKWCDEALKAVEPCDACCVVAAAELPRGELYRLFVLEVGRDVLMWERCELGRESMLSLCEPTFMPATMRSTALEPPLDSRLDDCCWRA